jgi:hypothetical protein
MRRPSDKIRSHYAHHADYGPVRVVARGPSGRCHFYPTRRAPARMNAYAVLLLCERAGSCCSSISGIWRPLAQGPAQRLTRSSRAGDALMSASREPGARGRPRSWLLTRPSSISVCGPLGPNVDDEADHLGRTAACPGRLGADGVLPGRERPQPRHVSPGGEAAAARRVPERIVVAHHDLPVG